MPLRPEDKKRLYVLTDFSGLTACSKPISPAFSVFFLLSVLVFLHFFSGDFPVPIPVNLMKCPLVLIVLMAAIVPIRSPIFVLVRVTPFSDLPWRASRDSP